MKKRNLFIYILIVLLLLPSIGLSEEDQLWVMDDLGFLSGFDNEEKEKEYMEAHNGVLTVPIKVSGTDVKALSKDPHAAYWFGNFYDPTLYDKIVFPDEFKETSDFKFEWYDNAYEFNVAVIFPEEFKNPPEYFKFSYLRNFKDGFIYDGIADINSTEISPYDDDSWKDVADKAFLVHNRSKDLYERMKSYEYFKIIASDLEAVDGNLSEYVNKEPKKGLAEAKANKHVLINPARIRVNYLDKNGEKIAPSEDIVGEKTYKYDFKIGNNGGDKPEIYLEKPLDNKYSPEERDKLAKEGQLYLKDYSIYEGNIPEVKEGSPDPTSLNQDDLKALHEQAFDETFFLLGKNREPIQIQPKAIEGYKAPKAKEVKLDSTDGFNLNKKDFVWEKEINLVYLDEEAESPTDELTVQYYVEGHDPIVKKVKKGSKAPKISDPEPIDGRKFLGWYKNNKKWDFDTEITEDLFLIAKFEEETPDKPDLDKLPLQNLVDQIKDEKEEDYTAETWSIFQAELIRAQQLLNIDSPTQEELDTAHSTLKAAYDNLRFRKPDKLKLTEVEEVPALRVAVNTEEVEALQQLPKTIEIKGSNGKTYEVEVQWKLYNYNGTKKGDYLAKGSYSLPEAFKDDKVREITTLIIVDSQEKLAFDSFDPLDKIILEKGQSLNLPSTVRVNYKDGTTRRLDVDWDTSNFDSNSIGTTLIKGSVEGIDEEVSIEVEVVDHVSDSTDGNSDIASKMLDIRGHWGERAIVWTLENGIFKGTYQNTFEPDRSISRGEFITVLYRLSGDVNGDYSKNRFFDVGNGAYYDKPIEWARQKNIVLGYEDNTFRPDQRISREELATIIDRFNNYMNFRFQAFAMPEFNDIDQVSKWAKTAVRQLQASGIMRGQGDNMFVPKSLTSRAEVAQILFNMDQYVVSVNSNIKTDMDINDEPEKKEDIELPLDPMDTVDDNNETILPNKDQDEPNVDDQNDDSEQPEDTSYATVSIDMLTLRNRMDMLNDDVDPSLVPTDGYVLAPTKVEIEDGESAFNALKRAAKDNDIDLDYEYDSRYNSVYLQAVNGIGEFSAGKGSGWMYHVNGKYPDRGLSIVKLKDGDNLQVRYTLNYGKDLGASLEPYNE